MIKKGKNIVLWTYCRNVLLDEKKLQKTNQKEFRIKKDDKLHVKLKGYDNSFNSWINKKDIVI